LIAVLPVVRKVLWVFALFASSFCAQAGRKVIIDQDAFGPGGPNLQPILMLLQAQDVELLAITVVSGDGWRDEEVAHTLRVLEIAGRTEIPVVAGAVLPLINTPERTKAWEKLYGALYYKGAWTEKFADEGAVLRSAPHVDPTLIPPLLEGSPKIQASQESAVSFLIRSVHQFPGEVTILAAGPMTNIALAAKLDPEFPKLARELVFMGGSFNPIAADNSFAAEYANSPRREFNMRFDPEAAHIVLNQPWRKITQVPVDPTTRTFFKPEYFGQIAQGRAKFRDYLVKYAQPFPMWDELAVAVWLDPSLIVRSAQLAVDIETSFTASYGDTLSWPAGAGPGLGEQSVLVVQEIDVPRFERMTVDLLSRSAASH
jgi:purine nucleosidase